MVQFSQFSLLTVFYRYQKGSPFFFIYLLLLLQFSSFLDLGHPFSLGSCFGVLEKKNFMEKFKWGYDQRFMRDSLDGTNLSFEKDRAYGFSWPQRNYRCSFCKKEFKSAQALGGHMNVHRRDRARMRLSPSWDSPNPNPNPSFPLLSPSSTAKFSPYNLSCRSSITAVTTNSPSSASLIEEKVPAVDHTVRDIMNICRGDRGKKNKGEMLELTSTFARRKDARVWKANEFVRLDLNLGLIQDSKEDLDLELRLGYS